MMSQLMNTEPTSYPEDDWLALSGIQHFSFCQRQWALIHIEELWNENERTAGGRIEHERTHDYAQSEKRGDLLVLRDLRVFSPALGVTGDCDVVEFHKDASGVELVGREGRWSAYPVEYKHGEAKQNDADRLQLCGEAMCLEEMLGCDTPEGALFYERTKRREKVPLDDALRNTVREMFAQMHRLYSRGYTPRVRPSKSCNACSLKDLCLPELMKVQSAQKYIAKNLHEISDEEVLA
jgi:CRISPR-associated exonuclease Cas4